MVALIGAVLLASLLGSPHCAGMCGGFALFAVGSAPGTRAIALQSAYHGGRLVTYLVLGALAGAIGAALDLGGGMIGVQRAAALMAGGMMVLFGGCALASTCGLRLPAPGIPQTLRHALAAGHRRALRLTPTARALVIGLLTTLLPCGWLYAFVITAAGTGNSLAAAVAMLAFWLGTLPVMGAVTIGARAISGPLGSRFPLLTSILLVAVGTYTLTGRLTIDGAQVAHAARSQVAIEATDGRESLADHAARLATIEPACCATGDADAR
ncbi:MAG: sulfite exporter TauE/SafE family protein [Phycisphaerales bacterium]|nr:sulfite exporter TauE/SafE family protein [Phycisphaerales bacterium]